MIYVPYLLRRIQVLWKWELILFILGFFLFAFFFLFLREAESRLEAFWLVLSFGLFPLFFFYWKRNCLSLKRFWFSFYLDWVLDAFLGLGFLVFFVLFQKEEPWTVLGPIVFLSLLFFTSAFLHFLFWKKGKNETIPRDTYSKEKKKWSFDLWVHFHVRFLRENTWFLFLYFLHVTLLSLWLAQSLELKTDLVALLPEDFPSVVGLKEAEEIFGGFGYLMLDIESDEVFLERKKWEQEHQNKLIDEFEKEVDGSIRLRPRINEQGQVVAIDEPVILRTYYHDSKGKEVLWHAELPRTKKLVRELVRSIENLDSVLYSGYRSPVEFFKNHRLLFLGIGDLALIYARVKKQKREAFLDRIGLRLDLDPSDSGIDIEDIEKKYRSENRGKLFSSPDGYYLGRSQQLFVVLIKPSQSSLDVDFSRKLYNDVSKIVETTKEEFIQQGLLPFPLRIGYGGRYKRKPDGTQLVQKDLEQISFFGLLFIIGVVILYFRRISALLWIGLPLIFSIVWTFGLTYLYFGYVNIITGFLSVILMGLGVDFGIHFLSRYREETEKGKDVKDSLFLMISHTGRASLTAVLTTLASFTVLIFTNFQGFNEFGLIGAIGIIMAYLSMLYILPLLLILQHQLKQYVIFRTISSFFSLPSFFSFRSISFRSIIQIFLTVSFIAIIGVLLVWNLYAIFQYERVQATDSFFSIPLYYFLFPYLVLLKTLIWVGRKISGRYSFSFWDKFLKRPQWILMGGVAILIVAFVLSFQVYFEYNFKKLEGMTLDSYQIEEKVSDEFNLALTPSILIARGEEQEREIHKILSKRSEIEGSTIDFVDALTSYVPEYQEEKIEIIEELKALAREFQERAKEEEFKDDEEIQKIDKQLEDWQKNELAFVDYIYTELLPEEVLRRFKSFHNREDPRSFVLVFPYRVVGDDGQKIKSFSKEIRNISLQDKWMTLENYVSFSQRSEAEVLKEIFSGGNLTFRREDEQIWIWVQDQKISASGENLILADILFLVEREAPFVLLAILVLIFLFVYLDFRSLRVSLLVLTPIAFGSILLFASMVILDLGFNILNVVVLPVILGVGLDSSVHWYHRYQHEGKGKILVVQRSTGIAIIFASLTTMLGFGSLMLAGHLGLNTIGTLAFLGIASSFFVAIFLFPALVMVLENREKRKLFLTQGNPFRDLIKKKF